jgi:hypothetical protein
LEFRYQDVLAPNRKYYVIIKGDSDINDATSDGVLSQSSIGMNGEGYATGIADPTIIDNPVTFNGLAFKNAKVWSFTTMGENEVNGISDGICKIDKVEINPSSYLFQTADNDARDDDQNNKATFDTIVDSDKVFVAEARASNGQLITATQNYNWNWTWSSLSPTIATAVKLADPEPFKAKVTAVKGVADGKAQITAKADLVGATISKTGTAMAYIILCKNIWPPFTTDTWGNSIWMPWQDDSNNCTAAAGGSCSATNFSLYYCRDAGQAGTADDLPAILSDTTVIRGKDLKCIGGVNNNVACNDDAGCPSGSCGGILKEFYFFREALPDVGGMNLATTTNNIIKQGTKAGLTWTAIADISNLDKYLVYYGTKSGSYEQSISATVPGTLASPFAISNLTNGVKYYFAVTAKYKSGAESGYSNETNFIPNDTSAPQVPADLIGTAGTGSAIISWTANTDDTSIYKVYYGATLDSNNEPTYGASVSLEKSKCSSGKCELTISNLAAEVKYYFAVTSLDIKANESSKSGEIDLTIL